MNITSLNIKGMGSGEKMRELRNFIAKEKLDILAPQETILEQEVDISVLNIWRHSEVDFVQQMSVGRSGGLLLLWNKDVWKTDHVISGDGFLGMIGEWTGKRKKYLLLNMYGPQLSSQKRALWANLSPVIRNFEGPIGVLGDFSVVRRPDEHSGCRYKPISAADFNSFLREIELSVVKQGGQRFTWVSWDGQKMSKLDRFLLNKEFTDDWADVAAVVGVTLKADILDFGPPPFRFYDHWLSHNGFDEVVKSSWDNQILGGPDFILKTKLKLLKK